MERPKNVWFEVVIAPEQGKTSIFDPNAMLHPSTLDEYRAPRGKSEDVARRLHKAGITVHHIGDFSISAECSANAFEKFFSTKISEHTLPSGTLAPDDYRMYAPGKTAPWQLPKTQNLDTMIDRVYIQHEPIFFSDERALPPFWNDSFRLRVPNDVAQVMRASSVHQRGITGAGVTVAMPDTGFYHHTYFKEQGYNFLSVPAPDTTDHVHDTHGHGTGECANLFATAPGINFIGVKMGNPVLGLKTAIDLTPDVITCSWGYNVDGPLPGMPNWLKPLHLTVLDAVSRGITVCFSAGNKHYGFPGSMPEVLSVGGVYVTENLEYRASNYASGFDSTWFPGRKTPDLCGLCGESPGADYIVLPVQAGSVLDREHGWGAFSGTSASSPMVAGVCALLKEINPSLGPNDIRNYLKYTARDIHYGTNGHGKQAQAGPDGATGYGLVDASRAIEVVL